MTQHCQLPGGSSGGIPATSPPATPGNTDGTASCSIANAATEQAGRRARVLAAYAATLGRLKAAGIDTVTLYSELQGIFPSTHSRLLHAAWVAERAGDWWLRMPDAVAWQTFTENLATWSAAVLEADEALAQVRASFRAANRRDVAKDCAKGGDSSGTTRSRGLDGFGRGGTPGSAKRAANACVDSKNPAQDASQEGTRNV